LVLRRDTRKETNQNGKISQNSAIIVKNMTNFDRRIQEK